MEKNLNVRDVKDTDIDSFYFIFLALKYIII